ncbi:MAG: efflux RND transporter periplasmic adaptor subunit [Phycisphaerales bacterium]|nr:efflux RND transporter periplasmic adaptor subunit [Phycisphaerales bacterium]
MKRNEDYPVESISLDRLGAKASPESTPSHPPLPKRKWKSRILAPLALLLVFGGILGLAALDVLFPGRSVEVIPVVPRAATHPVSVEPSKAPATEATVTTGGQLVAQGSGWVEPDPYEEYATALTGGVISEILVLDGEAVTPGQIVAKMVSDGAEIALAGAEAKLATAQAASPLAMAELQGAQSDWDNPIEQERKVEVTTAALAEIRAERKQLPALIAAEGALCKQLKDELNRMTAARKKEIATDFELKSAQYRLESQHAKHEAMIQRKAILDAKIAGLESEVKAAQRDLKLRINERRALDQAKAAVASAKATVASAESDRRDAKLRLDRMSIRAVKAGVVMRRLKSPGEKLSVISDNPDSAKVLSLYDPKKLQVRVDVAASEAKPVQVGQRAEVVIDIEGTTVFAGRVTRIVNEADAQKNTLEVKVAIDAPSAAIRPGMYGRVKFYSRGRTVAASSGSKSVGEGAGMVALYLPKALIVEHQGAKVVWLSMDGVAQRTEVTLGRGEDGDWVEVATGLRGGDRVIVGDLSDLRDGEKVTEIGESKDYR